MSIYKIDAVTGAQPPSGKGYPANPGYVPVFDNHTQKVIDSAKGAVNDVKDALKGAVNDVKAALSGGYSGVDTTGMYNYYDPNAAASGSSGSSDFSLPEYPNAALASLYGMSQETAYHEALENTAIQRRMMDYKAAGLNPVLAAQYNSGADSFSGSVAYPLSFGASQGSTPSGSSAGASYGGSSGKSQLGSFSLGKFMRNSDYRSAIAALASAGTMVATKNFQLGAAAYFGVRGLLNSVFGYKK